MGSYTYGPPILRNPLIQAAATIALGLGTVAGFTFLNASDEPIVQIDSRGNITTSGSLASEVLTAADCDVKATSTGQLICGTDSTGGGSSDFGDLSSWFINDTGDTMTGAFIVDNTLDVTGTMSGADITGSNLRSCDTIDTDANGVFSCGTDEGTTYTAGQGLQLDGTQFRTIDNLTGSTLNLTSALSSSGSITWEGTASGSVLYGGQFFGAGLIDCDGANRNRLQWDTTTQRFVCDTDQFVEADISDLSHTTDEVGTLTTGDLCINDGSLVNCTVNTEAELETALDALDVVTVTSSDITEANLYTILSDVTQFYEAGDEDVIAGAIAEGELANDIILEEDLKAVDTAADEECLTYETTTGDFEWQDCGSGGNTFAEIDSWFINDNGDTMTGSLAVDVNVTVTGTMTGNYLYAGTMSGAGLADCDTAATSKLLWDATTERFSCGTDQNDGGTGLSFEDASTYFVDDSGDTMTGKLLIDLTSGTDALEVIQTMSGDTVSAAGGRNFFTSTSIVFNNTEEDIDFTLKSNDHADAIVLNSGQNNLYFGGVNTSAPLYVDLDANDILINDAGGTTTNLRVESDTNQAMLFVDSANNEVAIGYNATSPTAEATLDVNGSMSGVSLTISSLRDCDTIDTDSAGVLSCGTDDGAGGGISYADATTWFVDDTGDTMTGALIIDVPGEGNNALTISGTFIYNEGGTDNDLRMEGKDIENLMYLDADNNAFYWGGNSTTTADIRFDILGAGGLEKTIFNEQSDNNDFRVETNTDTHAFYIDGGLDKIGMFAGNVPETELEISGTASGIVMHGEDTLSSSGTLVVEGESFFNGVLTCTGCIGVADVNAALTDETKCIWFEDPTASDDFESIWANKTGGNYTLTEIWGESDQTVNFDLQIDDGTPADVNGTDISPAAGEAEDTSLSGDTTLAAGEELDLAITSVSGTPTWVSICWTYTKVDQ